MYTQGYRPPQQAQPAPPQQRDSAWYAGVPTATPRRTNRASGTGGSPRAPRKRRGGFKSFCVKATVVLVLLAGLGVGAYVGKTHLDVKPYNATFLDRVSVDGIDLSGMTWEEGRTAVWAQATAKQSGWYVRLRSPNGQYKDITAETLGITFDPSLALEQAWALGHNTSTDNQRDVFAIKQEIEAVRATGASFSSAQTSADTSPIDQILNMLRSAAYIAPQDAQITGFHPDDSMNPFSFQNEVYGQQLDIDALREQILGMVSTYTTGEVLVQPTPIAPRVTVADLRQTVSLRYRAITPIAKQSTENRNNNIRLAFSRINGLVLSEGEKFSFNTVVKSRTVDNGYFEANEYAYGETVIGIGGGVCQASTTVFLAAIQSGLEIVDRTAHSDPVSYTDLGMDATVNSTRGRVIDFVFRNNSGGKIFLTAHVINDANNKNRLLCEVRIYGLSLSNTSYKLEAEVVETLPAPTERQIVEDEKQKYVTYTDEEKVVIKAREGWVVDSYLVTYVDGTETARVKVGHDTYKNRAERVYVGVTPKF